MVQAKRKLLQTRLFRERPWLSNEEGTESYPQLREANFNNLDEIRQVLESIILEPISTDCVDDNKSIENVILFEGVMIYLDEGIPHALLQLCNDILNIQMTYQMMRQLSHNQDIVVLQIG